MPAGPSAPSVLFTQGVIMQFLPLGVLFSLCVVSPFLIYISTWVALLWEGCPDPTPALKADTGAPSLCTTALCTPTVLLSARPFTVCVSKHRATLLIVPCSAPGTVPGPQLAPGEGAKHSEEQPLPIILPAH